MLSSMLSRPLGRVVVGTFILLSIFFIFAFIGGKEDWYSDSADKLNAWSPIFDDVPIDSPNIEADQELTKKIPISYNLKVPPRVGCEPIVEDLQLRLITEYSKLLKGIRYANIWGYLG